MTCLEGLKMLDRLKDEYLVAALKKKEEGIEADIESLVDHKNISMIEKKEIV
jgi:hypothetical protein